MSNNDDKSMNYVPSVAKKKSPGYPGIGLDKAFDLAKKIYDQAFDSSVDSTTMMQLMGYLGPSGAARSSISALKHFGLIEGRDQEMKLTELAIAFFQPLSSEEKAEAAKKAAWNPEVFGELKAKFAVKLPSDDVLKAYLVRQHEFGPTGADAVIKSLKDTEEFLRQLARQSDVGAPEGTVEVKGEPLSKTNEVSTAPAAAPRSDTQKFIEPKNSETFSFRVSQDAVVSVVFQGVVTRDGIDRLIRYLELAKEAYSDDAG